MFRRIHACRPWLWLVFLLVLFLASSAYAQATNGPLVAAAPPDDFQHILLGFLAVVLPAFATYLSYLAKQRMNIAQGSADAQLVDMTTQRAAGAAYAFLAKQFALGVPASPELRAIAVQVGVNNIQSSIPTALARADGNQDKLTRMVSGELGNREAADPNIAIAPAPITTPVIQVAPSPAASDAKAAEQAPTTITIKPGELA